MPMNLGLGLGPSRRAVSGAAPAFTPASLFTSGEQGAWFRPNNLSTMWQESTGRTVANAVSNPVGLVYSLAQGATLGAELISNGDFSNGTTNWTAETGGTLSVSSNNLVLDTTANFIFFNYVPAIATVAGRTYRVEIVVLSSNIGPSGNIRVGTFLSGNNLFNGAGILGNGAATFSFVFTATTTTSFLWMETGFATSGQIVIDRISCREVAGIHAFQPTAGDRPLLQQEPGPGSYYLDNVSSDALNWTAPAGTYTVAYVIPDGTVTILTGQSLSGATNVMLASQIVEYVAVNRALTGGETSGLTAYLQGVANP